MVYREDTCDDELKDDLPLDYVDEYGEPDETGHIYSISWGTAHRDAVQYPHSLSGFIPAVESPDNPFMKEYNEIKRLLSKLEKKVQDSPTTSNIFDLMS